MKKKRKLKKELRELKEKELREKEVEKEMEVAWCQIYNQIFGDGVGVHTPQEIEAMLREQPVLTKQLATMEYNSLDEVHDSVRNTALRLFTLELP